MSPDTCPGAAAAGPTDASTQDGIGSVLVHGAAQVVDTAVVDTAPDQDASQSGGRDRLAVNKEIGPAPAPGAAAADAGADPLRLRRLQQVVSRQKSQPPPPGSTTTTTGGSSHDSEGGLTLRSALNDLVDDIFALCVRYIIASHLEESKVPRSFIQGKHAKIAWLFLAALFTFGLQMTLVTLLWNAATTGNTPLVRPQPQKLWQQVGFAHQLLCRASQSDQIKHILKPLEECNCSSWWPNNTVPYDTAQACLAMAPDNMTEKDTCAPVVLSINESLASYGRGLFTNVSHQGLFTNVRHQANQSQAQREPEPGGVHFVAENWGKTRIDPFFFMVFAYISLAIVVHTEFKQGVWLCYIAAGAVGILPSFFGRRSRNERDQDDQWWIEGHRDLADSIPWHYKAVALLVPLLQLLGSLAVLATGGVLYLFEQNQTDAVLIIINSVALAFILEIDNKIGHILNLREDWRFPKVIDNTADGDDKINTRGQTNTNSKGGTKGKSSQRARAAGYFYMSLVGCLIYAEMCFLAPHSAAQVLSFSVVTSRLHQAPDRGSIWGGTGLSPQFLGNEEIPTIDWFPDSLWMTWSFAGFMDGYYRSLPSTTFSIHTEPPQGTWIIVAFVVYVVCTILFVGLLCARMLPSSSVWWSWALLCTQLLLALVVQLQDSTFSNWCNTEPFKQNPPLSIAHPLMRENCPRNFWWFVVVMCYLGFFVAMFLVWPPVFEWLRQRRIVRKKQGSTTSAADGHQHTNGGNTLLPVTGGWGQA